MSVCENMDWNEELASYIMRTLNCQFNCLHHMFDVLQLIIFSLIYFLILSFFLFSTFSNPIKFQIIANKITIPLSQSLSGLFIKINAKRPQKYHIKKHKTLVVCLKKIVRPTGQNLKYYNFKWYKRENKCTQNNHRHMFSRSCNQLIHNPFQCHIFINVSGFRILSVSYHVCTVCFNTLGSGTLRGVRERSIPLLMASRAFVVPGFCCVCVCVSLSLSLSLSLPDGG